MREKELRVLLERPAGAGVLRVRPIEWDGQTFIDFRFWGRSRKGLAPTKRGARIFARELLPVASALADLTWTVKPDAL